MANKQKISHYAAADSSNSKPDSSYPDRSRLALLYPKSKTYEQRKNDDKLRQQSYRRHWPKYPYLNIATYGSVVLGLMIWFAQNLNTWWFGSSDRGTTMSVVFFSFAVSLGLVSLLVAWVIYVNKQFSYFGGMIRVFWLAYAVLIAVLLVLWLSGWTWEYTNSLWVPVLAALHFVIVFFSAQRIIGRAS